MNEFHFLRPHWLWALFGLLAMLVYWLRQQKRGGNWNAICDAELLPFLLQDGVGTHTNRNYWWASAASLLAIIALAGPTWQRLPGPVFRNESALVIALDLSKSMDATDIKPSRLGKARFKIADLLAQRKDGQTALLVYSGDAFTVTPLTSDTATIASQLTALTTDIMPSSGSNSGEAIKRAVDLLKQAGVAQGHILLVCDSVDDASLVKVTELLQGYHLSVLGVGSDDGAPIKQDGGGFLKDEQGNIVVARLDEFALNALAEHGGGVYLRARNDDSDIRRLSETVNQIPLNSERSNSDTLLEQWDEFGPWLLLPILPWAALRFRKGLLLWWILLLPTPPAHAFDWQSIWQNADQRARQAFQQQDYQQAAQQFRDPQWRAAAQYKAGQYQEAAEALKDIDNADAHYNRGNALAKAGQLQAALEAYQQALHHNPQHEDALHNKKLVEQQLQKQQQPDNGQQGGDEQKPGQDQQPQQQPQSGSEQGKQQNQPTPQDSNANPDKADGQNKQQADAKPQNDQPAKPESDAAKTTPAQQKPQQSEPDKKPAATEAVATPEQQNQQRSQQMLKRIPDEPTGLLKRKFRYQYQDRRQTPSNGTAW